MNAVKKLFSIIALATLCGCEHHDEKTDNVVPSLTDKNTSVQSQSDDAQVTNLEDSKVVVPSNQSTIYVVTNQQSEEIWTSHGFGFEDISLTNVPVIDEGTNSLP